MHYRCIDLTKIQYLFFGWEDTLIQSCLQNIMGDVYVDNLSHAQSAVAVLGDFHLFVGIPNKELLTIAEKRPYAILVGSNERWDDLIEEVYKRAKAITRHAMKKNTNEFDQAYLKKLSETIPPGFSVVPITNQLYYKCLQQSWSRDFVAQFKDAQQFENLGLGFVVLYQAMIVSGASSFSRYDTGIEIQIETLPAYRRMGLASCCAASLILACLERGLNPVWDAHTELSAQFAVKLGYHYDYQYRAYELHI